MPDSKSSASSRLFETIGVVVLLAAVSVAAVLWCARQGYTLYYGDAEAHLNIARRVLDSRTPGGEQFGTVWLPLAHLLRIPFVMRDDWGRSRLAGAGTCAACVGDAGGGRVGAGPGLVASGAGGQGRAVAGGERAKWAEG